MYGADWYHVRSWAKSGGDGTASIIEVLSDVMIAVRNQVLKQTSGKQVPWEHSSLTEKFYFVRGSGPAAGTGDEATKPKEINPLDLEFAFWNSIKNSRNAAPHFESAIV